MSYQPFPEGCINLASLNPDPNDIGPAVLQALTMIKNGSGPVSRNPSTLFIPPAPLSTGGFWKWVTGVSANMAGIPADVEIRGCGDAGPIRIENANPATETLNIVNVPGDVIFRDLIWTGDPARGNDCAAAIRSASNRSTLIERCQFWGIQTGVGTIAPLGPSGARGVVSTVTAQVRIKDCYFIGCGFDATAVGYGAVLAINEPSIASVENCRFIDFDTMRGQGYNKDGGKAWVFCGGMSVDSNGGAPNGVLSIQDCFFDEAVDQQIWLDGAAAGIGPLDKIVIKQSWFNGPVGHGQSILANLLHSLDVEDCLFQLATLDSRVINATSVDQMIFRRLSYRGQHFFFTFGLGNKYVELDECDQNYVLDMTAAAPLKGTTKFQGQKTFIPQSIAGLQLDLNPTSGVTLVAGNVTNWLDESGVADATHHVNDVGAPPLFNVASAAFNNKPTVSFTGAQRLKSGVWTVPMADPFTIVLVGRQITAGANKYAFDNLTDPTQCFLLGDSVGSLIYLGNPAAPAPATTDVTLPAIYIGRLAGVGGAGSNIYVSSDSPAGADFVAGAGGLTGTTIGGYAGAGAFSGWEIARVLVYNKKLNTQEIQELNAYLSDQYAIPVVVI